MVELALTGIAQHSVCRTALADNPALQRTLSADVLNGAAAYAELKPEWQSLAERQRGSTVFQSPDLLATWARYFAIDRSDRLATVVVRQNGRAIMIWPLVIEQSALVRVARGAGAPIAQYDEILLDPDCNATDAFAAATEALVQTARPDVVLLERVRADGVLREVLGNVAPLSCAEGAPHADLSQGTAKLMASLKSRVTRQQKKRIRRFEEAGSVGFEIATSPEQAERWLTEAMALKYEWLRSTGRISRAFVRRETVECLTKLARTRGHPEASPRMVVSRLALDGRTAAIEMGFCQRRVYHLYLGAFAPEFANFGPGNILTGKLLDWCSSNGIDRYDMMAPRSRHKAEWQSGEVLVFDFALPVTARGRLYVAGVLRRLVPAMRDAFYALPESMRATLAGFALRNLSKAQMRPNQVDRTTPGQP
jgi:CelD/BcsL family acetyltransferase involved in cellulose biosynthesis